MPGIPIPGILPTGIPRGGPPSSPAGVRTTLLDLTQALAGSLPGDADVVDALTRLLRTGRVRTCSGARILLQDGGPTAAWGENERP